MVGYFLGLALVALVTVAYFALIYLTARRFYRRTRTTWSYPKVVWSGFVAAFGVLGLGASLISPEVVYSLTLLGDGYQDPPAPGSGLAYLLGLMFIVLGIFTVFVWIVVAYYASFPLPASLRVHRSRPEHIQRPVTRWQILFTAIAVITGAINAGTLAGTLLSSWLAGIVVGILSAVLLIAITIYIVRAR